MKSGAQITDFEKARADPEAHFSSPFELANATWLTRAQKLDLLRSWEVDEVQLQEAEAESMAGGERDRLREVKNAIVQVTKGDDAKI